MGVSVLCEWENAGYDEALPNLKYYDPLHQLARERKSDHPGMPYHILDVTAMEYAPLFDVFVMGIRVKDDNNEDFEAVDLPMLYSLSCKPDVSILDEQQQSQLHELLTEFQDIFSSGPSDIGRVPDEFGVCHRIQIQENVNPIATKRPMSSYSHHERQFLKQEIPRLLDLGIIRQSISPWVSAPVLPKKSDGSLRLCIDFRSVNAVTVPDPYPIPLIDQLLAQMAAAKYFTRLDVVSAFWQIPMNPQDVKYTGFITPDGKYEWVRMPFGLRNSSSSWQRFIDNMMTGIPFAIVYLDDEFIFSDDWELHKGHIKEVFLRFRQYRVKLKLIKCIFGAASMRCLGYIVGFGCYKPDPDKVAAIINLPVPRDAVGVKRILGATGYYRIHIRNYTNVAAPLIYLTRGKVQFIWTPECQEAYQNLKRALTSDPVLRLPDFNQQFILTTDWSTLAIGAVLSQEDTQTLFDHPVAFASRLLNTAERNYASMEGECLALVWAIRKFRLYLDGKHFIVYTDNRALQWLHTARHHNSKVERWALQLQEFSFEVRYKKGEENLVADCLSRNVDTPEQIAARNSIQGSLALASCMSLCVQDEAACTVAHAHAFPTQAVKIQREIEHTPCVLCGDPDGPDRIVICDGCKRYFHLTCFRPPRSVVPGGDWFCPACDPFFLRKGYPRVGELDKSETPLTLNPHDPYRDEDLLHYVFGGHSLELIQHLPVRQLYDVRRRGEFYKPHPHLNGWLMVYKKLRGESPRWLICPPLSVRWDIIGLFHDAIAHGGIAQTLFQLHQHYHWVGIKNDVICHVKSCEACQKVKVTPPMLQPIQNQVIYGPLTHVHIDLFGPLTRADKVKVWVCNMVDYFTKAAEFVVVETKEPACIARAFYDNWICRYGCPTFVTSDNGTEFHTEFTHMLNRMGVFHIHTAVAHPQSNGVVERLNQTVKTMLKAHHKDHPRDWAAQLPHMRQAYMNRKHSATNHSPNQMLYGFAPRLPVAVHDGLVAALGLTPDEHVRDLRDRKFFMNHRAHMALLCQQHRNMHARLERKCSPPDLQVGDLVWEIVQPDSPLHTATKGPFRVVHLNTNKSHAILETGATAARAKQRFQRHTSHLCKFFLP
jgi:hypothetical protein